MSSSGKSIADDIIGGLRSVTKKWTKQRKQEDRQSSARAYRDERLLRSYRETIKDAAFAVVEKAYMAASDNGTLPANVRQVLYAADPEIQQRTGRQLDDQYFTQTHVDVIESFRARCEARAYLWHVGEYDLHAAVDALQADAERDDLIERIEQDAVQAIMAAAFHPFRESVPICGGTPCLSPGFCAEWRKADARHRPQPTDLPEGWNTMSVSTLYDMLMWVRKTPQSTVEAVMHCVRTRGVGALKEPANRERLSSCDTTARIEINRRIARLIEAKKIPYDR